MSDHVGYARLFVGLESEAQLVSHHAVFVGAFGRYSVDLDVPKVRIEELQHLGVVVDHVAQLVERLIQRVVVVDPQVILDRQVDAAAELLGGASQADRNPVGLLVIVGGYYALPRSHV